MSTTSAPVVNLEVDQDSPKPRAAACSVPSSKACCVVRVCVCECLHAYVRKARYCVTPDDNRTFLARRPPWPLYKDLDTLRSRVALHSKDLDTLRSRVALHGKDLVALHGKDLVALHGKDLVALHSKDLVALHGKDLVALCTAGGSRSHKSEEGPPISESQTMHRPS